MAGCDALQRFPQPLTSTKSAGTGQPTSSPAVVDGYTV
jgi:hypothetical protein